MVCKCGYDGEVKPNTAGRRFCPQCHRDLDKVLPTPEVAQAADPGVCPGCGGPKSSTAKLCRSCYNKSKEG